MWIFALKKRLPRSLRGPVQVIALTAFRPWEGIRTGEDAPSPHFIEFDTRPSLRFTTTLRILYSLYSHCSSAAQRK
jgi:hypothetical protein